MRRCALMVEHDLNALVAYGNSGMSHHNCADIHYTAGFPGNGSGCAVGATVEHLISNVKPSMHEYERGAVIEATGPACGDLPLRYFATA
jgi:hypothetical protein